MNVVGIQADQRVLRTLLCSYLPDVDVTLKQHDIELSLITLHWFLTLFASVVHMKVLLRVWDLFFFDGSLVLFQVTLGMLKIKGMYCLQPKYKGCWESKELHHESMWSWGLSLEKIINVTLPVISDQ